MDSLLTTQLGRLHIRPRCHFSRSRGLRPYVYPNGRVILNVLLTIRVQNTISTPQTTASFAQNTSILAYPTKTLAWTRSDSSLASSLLTPSFRIHQPLQFESTTRIQSSTTAVHRARASIMAWLASSTRARMSHSQYSDK